MNILILSCGTRNKVVQYFKEALKASGRVITADCSPYAPALYEGDAYYITPRMDAPGYWEVVVRICKNEGITGVLSLIDPELSLLASREQELEAMGVTVIGSSYELCQRTLDKWSMYLWMKEKGYPCAKSYIRLEDFLADVEKGEIGYPVFVKPRNGSASMQISIAENRETAEFLFRHGEDMMLQEYMTGQEIGADCYIDLISKEVVSIFTKKKMKMRAGETDKAVSFQSPALFDEIARFITDNGFVGPIDIDIFEKDGVYYFSEVNPRFGGGYPHAYACGADHMTLIKNNLAGNRNEKQIGVYQKDVVMMKYSEIKLMDAKGRL